MLNASNFARRQMIDQQVRSWDVLAPEVLEVLAKVDREAFVPAAFNQTAFADCNIPLGHGQFMLAPKLDGKILQALAVQPGDQVLDVGSGSGFLAACLGRMSAHVRSLEIFAELAERAATNLQRTASNNVVVEVADAFSVADDARYDAIAITSSLPIYDARFQRALKVGGRLFLVLGCAPVMEAVKITRLSSNQWQRESLFETVVPPLVNATRPSPFNF